MQVNATLANFNWDNKTTQISNSWLENLVGVMESQKAENPDAGSQRLTDYIFQGFLVQTKSLFSRWII